ncbi:MAG: ATP-binding protein [bacterium]
MSLRTKLLAAQLPMLIALALVGFLAISTVDRLAGHSQTILRDNYRSVLAAQRMKEAIERMDSAALFKLSGRWEQGNPLASQYRRIFEAELEIEEGNLTEPGEGEAAGRLRRLWNEYQESYDAFAALDDPSAAAAYYEKLYPEFLAVKEGADKILAMNQDAMVRKSDQVRRLAARLTTSMVFSAILAAMAGLLLSVWLTRRLLRPLSVLAQAVRRLGGGDLEARAIVQGEDEIALLAKDFNRMADHLEEYRSSSLGELLQAQQVTQAAIDSLPDPVVVFDVEGNLINVNAASESVLGLTFTATARDPLAEAAPELREAIARVRAHVLGGRGPWVPKSFDEAVRVSSGGADRWFLPRAHPLRGEEGITGATVLLQDVTRLRRFDELKTDLVSTVAHEIRTPLTSLHMAIHLCLEGSLGELNEKQCDLLYAAREDCQRLETMVADLLDLSRIQSGQVEMKRRPVSVRSLLEAALHLHRSQAEERGVSLEMVPGSSADEEVNVDPERISLVLANLVTNAIRHTPSGGRVEMRGFWQEGQVRFEVSDTGEGILPEFQARVFDRFFRVPGAPARGAGLGLSICREVVEAHGGEIGVDSQPGRGSTFWFTLPLSLQGSIRQEFPKVDGF